VAEARESDLVERDILCRAHRAADPSTMAGDDETETTQDIGEQGVVDHAVSTTSSSCIDYNLVEYVLSIDADAVVGAVVQVQVLEWNVGEIVALESAQEVEASRRLGRNLCADIAGFMAVFLREVDAIVVLVDLSWSVAAHGEDGIA